MGATHFLTRTLPRVRTEMILHVLAGVFHAATLAVSAYAHSPDNSYRVDLGSILYSRRFLPDIRLAVKAAADPGDGVR